MNSNLPSSSSNSFKHEKKSSYFLRLNEERIAFAMSCLIDKEVVISMENGDQIKGLFNSFDPASRGGNKAVDIAINTILPSNGETENCPPKPMIVYGNEYHYFSSYGYSKSLFKSKDQKSTSLKKPTSGKFKTDMEISASKNTKVNSVLTEWKPSESVNESQLVELEKVGGEGWDQFETNNREYGVVSTFDENLYTTSLNLSEIPDSVKERAEMLAAEIENNTETNYSQVESMLEDEDVANAENNNNNKITVKDNKKKDKEHKDKDKDNKDTKDKDKDTQKNKGELLAQESSDKSLEETQSKESEKSESDKQDSPKQPRPSSLQIGVNALNIELTSTKLDSYSLGLGEKKQKHMTESEKNDSSSPSKFDEKLNQPNVQVPTFKHFQKPLPEHPKLEQPKIEPPKSEQPKPDPTILEQLKAEQNKQEVSKTESPKVDSIKSDKYKIDDKQDKKDTLSKSEHKQDKKDKDKDNKDKSISPKQKLDKQKSDEGTKPTSPKLQQKQDSKLEQNKQDKKDKDKSTSPKQKGDKNKDETKVDQVKQDRRDSLSKVDDNKQDTLKVEQNKQDKKDKDNKDKTTSPKQKLEQDKHEGTKVTSPKTQQKLDKQKSDESKHEQNKEKDKKKEQTKNDKLKEQENKIETKQEPKKSFKFNPNASSFTPTFTTEKTSQPVREHERFLSPATSPQTFVQKKTEFKAFKMMTRFPRLDLKKLKKGGYEYFTERVYDDRWPSNSGMSYRDVLGDLTPLHTHHPAMSMRAPQMLIQSGKMTHMMVPQAPHLTYPTYQLNTYPLGMLQYGPQVHTRFFNGVQYTPMVPTQVMSRMNNIPVTTSQLGPLNVNTHHIDQNYQHIPNNHYIKSRNNETEDNIKGHSQNPKQNNKK